jgi:hypothetical protein
MIVSSASLPVPVRALAGVAMLSLVVLLSGCANMSDGMTSAFADPAKYDLYNCKQLENERTSLQVRMAEQQGLMTKAQEGVGGSVVSEVVYRNEYIAMRGQLRNVEAAWAANKCQSSVPPAAASTPPTAPAAPAKPGRAGR